MLVSSNRVPCQNVSASAISHPVSKWIDSKELKHTREFSTYASGLKMVSQNQLLPTSGTVMVRTRATLARLMHVQNVSNAAWPLLGTIEPSNLRMYNRKCTLIRWIEGF